MVKMKFDFLDIIGVVLCAGEDYRTMWVIKNGDVECYDDEQILMGILFHKEDKFISCTAETEDKLHCVFEDEAFTIDIW